MFGPWRRAGTSSPSSGSSGAFAYIKCVAVDSISQQLQRNAHYKQHGPGTATVLHTTAYNAGGSSANAGHHAVMYVGTSKGMVLCFDIKQSLKQVLGSEIPLQNRCCAAVSAIDSTLLTLSSSLGGSTEVKEFLLVGYVTGEIALFDATSGTIIKRVTDIHTNRVVKLQIVRCSESVESVRSQLDFLTKAIHQLTSDIDTVSVALWRKTIKTQFISVLAKKLRDYAVGVDVVSCFPSLGRLMLIKLIGQIFSVTDYTHALITPLVLYMCQCITQSPVNTPLDVLKFGQSEEYSVMRKVCSPSANTHHDKDE